MLLMTLYGSTTELLDPEHFHLTQASPPKRITPVFIPAPGSLNLAKHQDPIFRTACIQYHCA